MMTRCDLRQGEVVYIPAFLHGRTTALAARFLGLTGTVDGRAVCTVAWEGEVGIMYHDFLYKLRSDAVERAVEERRKELYGPDESDT
jgi:hypothetical protein